MFIVSIVEALLLLIYVGVLLYEYSQRQVPFYVKLLTYISWILSFGVVFMVPNDIYQMMNGEAFDEILWQWIYWLNFIFCWIILPIFQEYEDAGEFTYKQKFIRSFKNNLIIYGYFVVFGIIFIAFLAIFNKLDLNTILCTLIALANAFGTLLVVVLLGHGLVAIPREYWNKAQYNKCLNTLYLEAAQVNHTIQDLYGQLLQMTIELIEYRNANPECIDLILNEVIPSSYAQIPDEILENAKHHIKNDIYLTTGFTELNKRAKRKAAEYRRANTKWEHICSECFLLEDLLDNEFSVHYKIRSTLRYQRNGKINHYLDILQWFYYTKLKKIFLISLSIIFWMLSTIVILSEISCFSQLDINLLSRIINTNGFLQIQFSILIPLMYISCCAFYGLFKINFAGLYGFYDHQQTDAPSLLFGSINFSRVSFPLTFNFLQMIRINGTPFEKVIGNLDTSDILGMSFSYSLPILLIVVSFCNFFDVYDKLLSTIGWTQLRFTQTQFSREEGERLICKARVKREREILNKVGSQFFEQCEMRELRMIQFV